MKKLITCFTMCCIGVMVAQQNATSGEDLLSAIKAKTQYLSTSKFKSLSFENIGPSIMSGRVVDLAVNENDPTEFYVAYATAGVWHTTDNGISFNPIFDNAPTQNVGDIAVHWESRTIYVGTGENNSSRSSYAGTGLYKSTDNGENWTFLGLEDSHHIGRIVINPENAEHIVVGSVGHLYSNNPNRGVFSSTNGGVDWMQTLYVNDSTGIIDLAHAPEDFNVMYAASWQKDRKAWNFDGSGSGSGIYKSTDAGTTWTLITKEESGFPTGAGVGRIGLAVTDANTVFAVHDSQFRRPKAEEQETTSSSLEKDDFKSMSKADFLGLDDKKLNAFLRQNRFPSTYKAASVKQMVKAGKASAKDVALFLEDANSMLFDTPVVGAELYKSTDGGTTFAKTHEDYLDGLFFSYGYYFAQVTVDPSNTDKIYLAGVPIIRSDDGGKTFSAIGKENVHSDHHAIWVNPNKSGHIINGNDGGVNITYNDGEDWMIANTPAVGQFYAINVDHQKPYQVYGGLQDNGVWKAPHNSPANRRWLSEGQNPWKRIMGGDGMQVQIDNRDANIVYTGLQFGNYYRLNLADNSRKFITPKHSLGESPYRFNWQTPILLSSHNQDVLYMGSNKLHRSMDQGDNWTNLSEDLTAGGRKGNVAFGTLTTISESVFDFGTIYTGSDDGLVQLTRDGGKNWSLLSENLPQNLWVSRVAASKHSPSRVYLTLNGYRWDDFSVYAYVSEDYGSTWKQIAQDIPMSPANVILEDPHNESVLFIGTDNGVYVSVDRGASWESLQHGIPEVAVHDLVIQPEAKDLLVGTHGRSIYRLNIEHIEALNSSIMNKNVHFFKVNPVKANRRWGMSWSTWSEAYVPSIDIPVYLKNASTYVVSLKDKDGVELMQDALDLGAGLHYLKYNLSLSEKGIQNYESAKGKKPAKASNGMSFLSKGTYSYSIVSPDGVISSTEIKVE